ncbi:MAG TPA: hypothetical protein VKA84_13305 [Gemmatimonadaceae bacterium]|nr:hypothetical protein [Gemmatimonadaceae bacterium]
MPNVRSAAALASLRLSTAFVLAAPRAIAAQDSAVAAPPARTVPGLGAAPAGPKHALWMEVGTLFSERKDIHHPDHEFEYEHRVSRRVTIAAHAQRWTFDGESLFLSPSGSTRYHGDRFVGEVRARYYLGDRPMRGWWVAAGGGYARSYESFTGADKASSLRQGVVLSGEAGYTWLLGDGARNRLGVTLGLGGQRYSFRGLGYPMGGQFSVGPRLRLGWTF